MAAKKYYIVKKGFHPGVYYSWAECQKEVQGFHGAVYKGFVTKAEAEAWYGKPVQAAPKKKAGVPKKAARNIGDMEKDYPAKISVIQPAILTHEGMAVSVTLPETLTIYTDGSCLINPNGPGGFAAVFLSEEGTELLHVTGGEPSTTNNRMELRAAYEALKYVGRLGGKRTISFHTDSKYLQRAFMNHWVDKWQANGWVTTTGSPVANQDLWKGLLSLMARQHVTFSWVKGHVGTKYNELCDKLAKREAFRFMK